MSPRRLLIVIALAVTRASAAGALLDGGAPPARGAPIVRVSSGVGGLVRRGNQTTVRFDLRHDGDKAATAVLRVHCLEQHDNDEATGVRARAERVVQVPARGSASVEVVLQVPRDTRELKSAVEWSARARNTDTRAFRARLSEARQPPNFNKVAATIVDETAHTLVVIAPAAARGSNDLGLGIKDGIVRLSLGGRNHSEHQRDWMRVVFIRSLTELPQSLDGYDCVDTIIDAIPPPLPSPLKGEGADSKSRTGGGAGFSAQQQSAFAQWLRAGGSFICAGIGETPEFLTALLPATITRRVTITRRRSDADPAPLAQLTHREFPTGSRLPIVAAKLRDGAKVILGSKAQPLLVECRVGQRGRLVWIAFDPAREPLRGWAGVGSFWKFVLSRYQRERADSAWMGDTALDNRLRQVSTPRVPSRYWSLAPLVGYALALLLLTIHLSRSAQRKEWTWLALLACAALFATIYTLGLRRALRAESLAVGVTTRYLRPGDDTERQTAQASVYLSQRQPLELRAGAADMSFTTEDDREKRHPEWTLRGDDQSRTLHLPAPESVTHIRAARTVAAGGGIEARIVKREGMVDYHLTNRTKLTLRNGRVLQWVQYKEMMVQSLPTLAPGAEVDITLDPASSEVWTLPHGGWSTTSPSTLRLASTRSGRKWELSRSLTEAVLDDHSSLGWMSNGTSLVVAFTDAPPFPVSVSNVRQDWQHAVVVSLRGPWPGDGNNSYADLRYQSRLLAAPAPPREDANEGITYLSRGEHLFELDLDHPRDGPGHLMVSLSATELGGARAEWALFNWKTGRWTPSRNWSGYEKALSMDHIHPTAGIAHARVIVKGKTKSARLALRSFSAQVSQR